MAADVGEIVERRIVVRTAAGAPVAADSLPTWAVTLPDGTAGTPPTVLNDGLGQYYVLYLTTTPGMHLDAWTATVGGQVQKQAPGTFRVRSATRAPLLDLDEARTLLGVGIDPVRDERIRDYIDSAAGQVEDYTGRIYRRQQVIDTFVGPPRPRFEEPLLSMHAVALRSTPAISVSSVTDGGTTLATTAWEFDQVGGVVRAIGGAWYGPIVVTYQAGYTAVPDEVLAVVRQVLQFLWSTQSGGTNAPRRAGSNTPASLSDILGQLTDFAPGIA
jgi:hypothetical protein